MPLVSINHRGFDIRLLILMAEATPQRKMGNGALCTILDEGGWGTVAAYT
jgi:hypothetical protein